MMGMHNLDVNKLISSSPITSILYQPNFQSCHFSWLLDVISLLECQYTLWYLRLFQTMLQIADGPVELPLNLTTLWARLGKTIRMGRKSSAATLLKPTFQRRSELQAAKKDSGYKNALSHQLST